MNKALKRVVIVANCVSAAMAAGKLIHSQVEKLIDAKAKQAEKALQSFIELNGLTQEDLQYVSDSGYDPIYIFDGNKLNFDELKAPRGYVLQKNILSDGCGVTYQLAERICKDRMISCYFKVLVNFCNEEDWEAAE